MLSSSPLSSIAAGLTGLLLLAWAPLPTAAQQPSDSIRAEALKDFHGPDMTGKDGPLAKAGLELLILYHEYRAFQRRGGDTFSPSVAAARVADGHVVIDAIAMTEARQLRADLKALGLKDAAIAGRAVSGRFPIDQIPALAEVASLRGVVLSRMRTHGDATGPSPAEHPPKAFGDTSAASSSPDESPDDGGAPMLFLMGLVGILLLTDLF
ncbi:MAG: hypothetical protein ABEL51_02895 [Salinibacter sp.]